MFFLRSYISPPELAIWRNEPQTLRRNTLEDLKPTSPCQSNVGFELMTLVKLGSVNSILQN